jgi:hypothetical protein
VFVQSRFVERGIRTVVVCVGTTMTFMRSRHRAGRSGGFRPDAVSVGTEDHVSPRTTTVMA